MLSLRYRSSAFSLAGVFASLCFQIDPLHAQQFGPVRPVVIDPPSCPEYLLGQIDGFYYYATSDCKDQTGYGQSPELITLPQCSEGVCGRKVSDPGAPQDPPDNIPQEELDAWKAAIAERLSQFDQEIAIRSQTDQRRSKLSELKALGSAALKQLDSSLLSPKGKFTVNANFNKAIGNYLRTTQRVGFPGFSGPTFTIEDRPMFQAESSNDSPVVRLGAANSPALKSSADVKFDTSKAAEHNKNAGSARYQVQVAEGDVLKVPVGNGKFAFFKTFFLTVRKGGVPTRLNLGVQVSETASAIPASFLERGSYAHRVKSGDVPFLVNSVEMLSALPRE